MQYTPLPRLGVRRASLAVLAGMACLPASSAAAGLSAPDVRVTQRGVDTVLVIPRMPSASFTVEVGGRVRRSGDAGGVRVRVPFAQVARRPLVVARATRAGVVTTVAVRLAPARVIRAGVRTPTLLGAPLATTTSTSVRIALRLAPLTTAICAIDRLAAKGCGHAFGASGLRLGSHVVTIITRDSGGRPIGRQRVSWRVVGRRQLLGIAAAPAESTPYGNDSRISLVGPAPSRCSLDGSAPAPCLRTYAFTTLAPGGHVFTASAKSTPFRSTATVRWQVSAAATAPSITIDAAPTGDVASRYARVDFHVSGLVTRQTCALDGGDPRPCAATWSAAPLAPGQRRLVITVAGPGGLSSRAVSWRVLRQRIYWGAWVDGSVYPGLQNPPWDMRALDSFEASAGKNPSILDVGWPWYQHGVASPFRPAQMDAIRARGVIPMLDWLPWDTATSSSTQPDLQLADIIRGDHDAYIRSFATAAAAWDHPFFLRFAHEMNGSWYSWSERRNGNVSGEYVSAWRHIHDIFVAAGATKVTWVWCPNVEYKGSQDLASLYPGDAYVDWVGLDGYNWGTNRVQKDTWRSFSTAFAGTYRKVATVSTKPVMIAEVASDEGGGSKAAWISDAFSHQLIDLFPRVGAVVWFNWGRTPGLTWPIESSTASRNAFRGAIASPYYATNEFGDLSGGSIQPLAETTP